MPNITIVGSVNTDLVVRCATIPLPGQTLLGHSFLTTGGGKGANQAVAAARLGGTVSLVAKIGTDAFGKMSADNFRQEGIDLAHLSTDASAPSGVAVILVDDKGENVIVVAPGANATLNIDDVLSADQTIQNADMVLLQLEIPMETVAAAIKLAKKHNRVVMMNPAPAAIIPVEILGSIDIITPNESEVFALTGIVVNDASSAREACDHLHEKGIAVVIITMGSKGAYLSSANYKGLIAGFDHVKAVDTVAAGDTFCGALAIAITEQKELLEAVRFANAAAALSVTKVGAQASIPSREEVEKLLADSNQ